jgi:hypothetical protein
MARTSPTRSSVTEILFGSFAASRAEIARSERYDCSAAKRSPTPKIGRKLVGIVPVAVSRPARFLSMRKLSSARCSHLGQVVSAWQQQRLLEMKARYLEGDRLGHDHQPIERVDLVAPAVRFSAWRPPTARAWRSPHSSTSRSSVSVASSGDSASRRAMITRAWRYPLRACTLSFC